MTACLPAFLWFCFVCVFAYKMPWFIRRCDGVLVGFFIGSVASRPIWCCRFCACALFCRGCINTKFEGQDLTTRRVSFCPLFEQMRNCMHNLILFVRVLSISCFPGNRTFFVGVFVSLKRCTRCWHTVAECDSSAIVSDGRFL